MRCVKIDHPDSSSTSSSDYFLNEVTTCTLLAVAVTMTLALCVVVVIVVVTYMWCSDTSGKRSVAATKGKRIHFHTLLICACESCSVDVEYMYT